MSEVKDIPQEKLDRLWGHLFQIEKKTSKPLRGNPRYRDYTECPLENFAPDTDKAGRCFGGVGMSIVVYKSPRKVYRIHEYEDSDWWLELPEEKQLAITKWVVQKIKEHNETQTLSRNDG